MSKRKTPLAIALAENKPSSRATPMDAFALARQNWLDCKKLNLGAIAEELGVSRATLFRWIGNKDLLMGEIIWSVYKPTVLNVRKYCTGEGVDYIVNIFRELHHALSKSEPLRYFLQADGQYALSILSSNSSPFHKRLVQLNTEMLVQEMNKGLVHPAMNVDSLSYFMVRIGESWTFSEMIIGQKPEFDQLEDACTAVRILLGGAR